MPDNQKNAPELNPTFVENMRAILGDETEDFLRALDGSPALSLRINPLRPFSAAAAEQYAVDQVPWEPNGRYLVPGVRPGASIAHFSGAFYIQEASAMLPASILDARPGEKILDLCAAPGGKSSQIAAALAGRGLIVSNEPDLRRAKMLAGNLERLGARNALVVSEYPPRLAEKWPGFFDAIMVDAPCSGEGMFRREPDSRAQWRSGSPEGCAQRQTDILNSAALLLRPGGRMVYSTCAYNSLEDEGVVERFLKTHPGFSLMAFRAGGLGDCTDGMAKIWPHRLRGDGQFAALLIKEEENKDVGEGRRRPSLATKSDAAAELYRRFISEFVDPGEGFRPELWGDTLYAAPDFAPDPAGLRVVSPGFALARVLKGRLEPTHQLAMGQDGLPGADMTGEMALEYVRGAAVPCEGTGWLVARYGGMPLGWGKASGGVLKNHLPKGLRRNVEL